MSRSFLPLGDRVWTIRPVWSWNKPKREEGGGWGGGGKHINSTHWQGHSAKCFNFIVFYICLSVCRVFKGKICWKCAHFLCLVYIKKTFIFNLLCVLMLKQVRSPTLMWACAVDGAIISLQLVNKCNCFKWEVHSDSSLCTGPSDVLHSHRETNYTTELL